VQAQIVGLQEWKDGTGYPILVIQANHPDNQNQKEELEALQLIEKSVSEIVGHAYGGKIASTQESSGQKGLFTVDLSAILTMLKATQQHKGKTTAANAWAKNWLKDKVRPEWLESVSRKKDALFSYTCRCKLKFKHKSKKKAESRWLKHQKKCTVLKELAPFFTRCGNTLERLRNGGKKEKSVDKTKARKAKGLRPAKTAERRKGVVSGTKAGRTKRNHRPKKRS
jgi:hypothetical protein